jgi:hypothetical protein
MTRKGWVVFVCTQAAGITAMHLGSDRAPVPGWHFGLPVFRNFTSSLASHKMIMVGDARLAIAGITLYAMVWLTVAIWVSRSKDGV